MNTPDRPETDVTWTTRLAAVARDVAREVVPAWGSDPRLIEAVFALSQAFTRARASLAEVANSDAGLAARLAFFLPRDAPKVWRPLAELGMAVPRDRPVRVWDLGAGVGATSVGAAHWLAAQGATQLVVDAVDRWAPGLVAFSRVAAQWERLSLPNLRLRTHTVDATKLVPSSAEPPDLVLMGLMLNELPLSHGGGTDQAAAETATVAWLQRWVGCLAPGGALIIIEPALKQPSRWLQRLRDRLAEVAWAEVVAPCPRVARCPLLAGERDWCHQRDAIALPEAAARLAAGAGLRTEALTYAYLALQAPPATHQQDRVAAGLGAAPERALRVVSDPLPSKGKHELLLCGAPGRVLAMRLDRARQAHNVAIDEARRGDWLVVEQPPEVTSNGRWRIAADCRVRRVAPAGAATGFKCAGP